MDDIVQQNSNTEWQGFPYTGSDFFKVPNNFMDVMASMDLSELKVVLYVMRHTWGFQEYDDFKKITTDEFMYGRKLSSRERMDSGTGLSDRGVKDGLVKAIQHGYLECITDDTDRARIQKSYHLKMKPDVTPDQAISEEKPKTGKERIKELQTMPYSDYLQTKEWASKRAKALRFAQYHCQLCNASESLNVHHRTYERRGNENMGDLIVLCKDCHDTFTYNRNLTK